MPRPPTRDFAIGVPQRSHGSPPRPYTLNSFCIAPLAAVRQAVVAKRRALPRDAVLERGADRVVQPPELVAVDALGRAERMDPRAPERLVDVDVPEAGERPLVEERGLDRRAALRDAARRGGRP